MKKKINVISLADFCAMAKRDVDDFYRYWREQMDKHDIAKFPTSMDIGEWYGQFESFQSSHAVR